MRKCLNKRLKLSPRKKVQQRRLYNRCNLFGGKNLNTGQYRVIKKSVYQVIAFVKINNK